MADAVEPHYIRIHDVDESGASLDEEWKCWLHSERGVWELRRVIASAKGALPQKFLLHEWVKQHKGKLIAYFKSAGLSFSGNLIPSRKAFAAQCQESRRVQKEPPEQPVFLHEEWAITTCALIVLLVFLAQMGKSRLDKHRSDRLLKAFLAKLLPPQEALQQVRCDEVDLNRCSDRVPHAKHCEHLAPLLGRIAARKAAAPQHLVCDLVVGLFQEQQCCVSAHKLLCTLVVRVGVVVDQQVPSASWTTDATETQLLDTSLPDKKRRRRIDEDFKHAVATKVVASGRAGTSAAFLRSKGATSSTVSASWEERVVLEAQASSWASFASAPTVSIAIDGSRVGQPAQEMEVCFAWDPARGIGSWCPPQARVPGGFPDDSQRSCAGRPKPGHG